MPRGQHEVNSSKVRLENECSSLNWHTDYADYADCLNSELSYTMPTLENSKTSKLENPKTQNLKTSLSDQLFQDCFRVCFGPFTVFGYGAHAGRAS
jgi:hypothetical protein